VRRAIARVLGAAGHDVTAVALVSEAFEVMTHTSFDLLVADAVLPDGGPTPVIEELRNKRATYPVLVCSGYMPDPSFIEGSAPGRVCFLQKPVSPKVLMQTVDSLLAPELAKTA
jgi:DNA-binding NtrC family response regulator